MCVLFMHQSLRPALGMAGTFTQREGGREGVPVFTPPPSETPYHKVPLISPGLNFVRGSNDLVHYPHWPNFSLTFCVSGETAKGSYPAKSVLMMHRICREAEAAIFHKQLFDELRHSMKGPADTHETTAIAAVAASFTANAAAIICLTHSGK